MNAVRLSHYPPDPAFLEACDELGLYVIDELGGWHGKYDTETGKQLVREMVTRDLNHPSIIWWSNGNEGGWNTELDPEFARWDWQKRPLIHPQGNYGGFETMHYRSYGETQEYMRKPELFMPTEMLHGLYDGGHGAGLADYWEIMRRHPRCVGGFLWVLADEGVVRTDQDNRIDNCGNYGADGMVGPHHEKEGSYYTVRQVWCPVQISQLVWEGADRARLSLENRYDFTNLDQLRFKWQLVRWAGPYEDKAGFTVLDEGTVKGPDVAPRLAGDLRLTFPAQKNRGDALRLTAMDAQERELWTWVWPVEGAASFVVPDFKSRSSHQQPLQLEETDSLLTGSAGSRKWYFSKTSGRLIQVQVDGNSISLGNGPRFVAARRGDRSWDVFYNHDDPKARSKERIYQEIPCQNRLTGLRVTQRGDSCIQLEETFFGPLLSANWTITPVGAVSLEYAYQYDGVVELMGIAFDYPEPLVLAKRWLGNGPYRVWQNRLQGPVLGVWQVDYNDPVPAETFIYPEFKGYFSGWKWIELTTREGKIRCFNGSSIPYLGVYQPRDGRDALLYTLPETGLAFLEVIPAVRNKVNATDLIGPSSQAPWSSGIHTGKIWLEVESR